MSILLPDNHIALASANEIRMICEPLFLYTPITHFDFFRDYADNTRIWFSNNSAWGRYFHQQEYTNTLDFDFTKIRSENNHLIYSLSTLMEALPTVQMQNLFRQKLTDAHTLFDITNGIAVIESNDSYCDYFGFCVSGDESYKLDFLLSHYDIIETFILYFKEKSEALRLEHEKTRIQLPEKCTIDKSLPLTPCFSQSLSAFYKALDFDRLSVTCNQITCTLSKVEYACLGFALMGYSLKLIAYKLKITPRACDYSINKVMKAFGYSSKTRFFENLHKTGEAKKLTRLLQCIY